MTFTVAMRIEAEADSAKAALAETAAATRATGAAAREATAPTTALGAAQARAANQGRALAAAVRPASVQVGLLGAQFNDIGVQLAAGTSPLLVAVQQGTQISQAIGPLGAAGAARALGSAFLSVVNPVSLLTIGAIAAGGALLNMLTGSSEDADALGDAVDSLEDGVDAFKSSAERALTPLSKLREEFGSTAERARELFQEQSRLRELDAIDSLAGARAQVEEFFGRLPTVAQAAVGGVAEAIGELRVRLGEAAGRVQSLLPVIQGLETETGVTGLVRLGEAASRIAREFGVSAEAGAEMVEALAGLGAASGPQELADALKIVQDTFARILGGVENLTPEQRAFLEEMQRSEVAALGLLGKIEAISGATGAAAANAAKLAASISGGVQGGRGTVIPDRADIILASLGGIGPDDKPPKPARGGGRSAEAREADRQAEAIERVFERLRDERDLLLETDPVQREMIRLRGQLAGATREQTDLIEAEIAANLRLKDSLETQQQLFDELGQVAFDVLDGLVFRGEKADDVLKGLLSTLLRTVAQGALLGTGPLGDFFGGTSLLGSIFGGAPGKKDGGQVRGPGGPRDDLIPAFLSNGEFVVNAPATKASLPLLEAINAGRGVARFADGGLVGRGFRPPVGAVAAGESRAAAADRLMVDLRLSDDLEARIEASSERVAVRESRRAVDRFSRSELPRRQREIERTGGIIG